MFLTHAGGVRQLGVRERRLVLHSPTTTVSELLGTAGPLFTPPAAVKSWGANREDSSDGPPTTFVAAADANGFVVDTNCRLHQVLHGTLYLSHWRDSACAGHAWF
eukprot:SAG11_NODE_2612_length_3172_cov_3.416206_1_plen_105_part_00